MSSPLRRLASALAGRSPIDPLQSPPEALKPFPATLGAPTPVPPPPAPSSAAGGQEATARGQEAPALPPGATYVDGFARKQAPSPAGRPLTYAGRTQSIRAWASTLGIDRRTLAYRLNHGWSTEEALGFVPRPRNHAAEQARSSATRANTKVLIVDADGEVVPRAEAATRLGIKPKSLTHRLRQYRHPDGTPAKVLFSLLDRR